MGIFNKNTVDGGLLEACLGETIVTKELAMEVPYISGCIDLICGLIAGLPIKLYKEEGKKTEEVKGDRRLTLLNDDTGDLLNGYTLKYNMISDYLLYGRAFTYINRERNTVKSLHYVDNMYVNVFDNFDPIFKDVRIHVVDNVYRHNDFISLNRNSYNGIKGEGLITQNKELIILAYKALKFQRNNVETGGIKKGVIKSGKKLTDDALKALKESWRNLYGKDSTENCVILNDGLDYKELANTPMEMQLAELLKSIKEQICGLLKVALSIFDGTATENTYQNFIKTTIMPIINALEAALNQTLLLEREKSAFYFAVDTKELLKGDLLRRYQAYKIGLDSGFLQIDDVRYEENCEPLGIDFIKLGLDAVMYYPETKTIYVPNTKETYKLSDTKGGDVDEGGNQGQQHTNRGLCKCGMQR